MSRRSRSASLTVRLLREGIVESVHICEVAIADYKGRILAAAGDPEKATFARSCLKPIQALAVSSSGTLEHFHLSDRHLAIMCGSHLGTVLHARQTFQILWQCDIDPSALQCPLQPEHKSTLQHNCSGKHAGMIAVCQHHNWNLSSYTQRQHPVQQLILQQLAELLHMPPAEFIGAHDDCTVPTYLLEIGQLASLYAHLTCSGELHLQRIARAMVAHPDLVGGEGTFDTEVMTLTQGEIVSKAGAEGLQCLGKMREGLGIAIKVADGSKRAKQAVAIHVLHQLGWITSSVADRLAESFMMPGAFTRLEVEGELS